ncbi:hypothetical protein KZ478_08995, partial [Glaesserella parasuis]|nr:hypothetical protein [Glaesserella parasuis]
NLLKQINDKEKNGLIKVEFVLPENNTIHYLEIVQSIARKSEYPLIKYASIPILDKDTSTSARKRLMEFFLLKKEIQILRMAIIMKLKIIILFFYLTIFVKR